MEFDWGAIAEALPALLQGASTTLYISAVALSCGTVFGGLLGVIRAYGPKWLSITAQIYIGLIRGTPMVVQIMFVYFALPILFGIRISALSAGLLALFVNSSAYLAEIVRGGFLAVPRGLTEAGLSMGLPFHKVLMHILAPVAFRKMIPALGNQWIIGLKDTSLLLVIGVAELTRTGQEIMTENYRAVEIWCAVAVVYLAMVSLLALAFKIIEKRTEI